jgi:CzcA family heavy metal efflux pump
MIRWIVGSSLRFRGLVVAAAAVVLFLGVTQLRDAPVDVLPEFAPPTVEIQTEALGLSAVEVEQLITVPFEQDLLNGLAFVEQIRSESVPGLSRIQLFFEPGTNLFRARQVVAERLAEAQVALPNVSKPPQMLQPLSSTNRVMMVRLSSTKLSAIETSVLARWVIKPRLLAVPGVANVAVWGFRDRQLQVQVDPERLRDQGVSLAQVIETTGNALWASPLTFVEASVPGTGGFIDTANQRLGVMHVSPIVTADDLAQVRVQDTAYRLGDVATVVEDHQPLIGDANGGSGLMLVVEKFPEANTLEVTRDVEGAIDALRPGLSGLEFDTSIFRPASFIEESIDNLTLALIIASVLVVLLLGAFFFDWRAVLIGVVAIPLSLLAAGLVLYALGQTINAMVVAGFVAALALLVYDAVGEVENVRRRLREQGKEPGDKSTADLILEASLELRGAAVYATLIVALALLPVFVLEGVAGEFLPPLAVSYLLAALASMAVALTVTPALSLLLLSKAPLERRESPLVRRLLGGYEAFLSVLVRRPGRVYVAVGALAVAGFAALPFLGPSLSPSFKETELLIHLNGPPGTSLQEMNRITTQASRELRSIPGVRDVGVHVGRAVTSDQAVNVNSAELWASIEPEADYDATVASVQEAVGGYPGLSHEVLTFSSERVREVLTGADDDIVVRIFGEDLGVLRSKAEEVRQFLAQTDGVVDPEVKLQPEEPTLEIGVDLAAAERYGIKPGDVRRAAAALLSGIEVGSLFEEQKVFGVVVWGTPENRNSLTSIRELLIDTPSGGHVRLGDVAQVRVAPSPAVIRHESVSRYVDVAANVEGRSLGSVEEDVERRLQEIQFPLEYHAEVLDPEGRTPQGRLVAVGIAAAIGVLLLLQACFGSWRLAFMAFLALPFALAGGALGTLADGGTLSLGSLVGFFALLGIAARNGILMVTHFQHLERHEGETFGPRLVVRGGRERVLPMLVTALATGLAVLPFAVLGEIPGYELVHPLAVVVLGGLVTSTLLTLLVVPPLYLQVASGSPVNLIRRSRERISAAHRALPRT